MGNGNGKNMPVKKFRAGGVSVAIWENINEVNGQKVPRLSATMERRYKDKNGEWKSTGSLQPNDVAKAIHVLAKAYDYMVSPAPDSAENPDNHVGEEGAMY